MSVTDKSKVWRKDGVEQVEQYDLPKWDRNGKEVKTPKPRPVQSSVAEVQQETVQAPTVKELQAIREDAYNEGFEQGYQQGQAEGRREGLVSGKKEGQQQGYDEGFANGTAEGTAQALAEQSRLTEEKLQVLAALSSELASQIESERHELENALLALSVRIARQVLQDELRAYPEHIHAVVHAAVQSLPNPDEKLTVYVNPLDLPEVEKIADSHWQVSVKESVSRGGCEVKSGFSYVDFTLGHRFDTAVNQLLAHIDLPDTSVVKDPISEEDMLSSQPVKNLAETLRREQATEDIKPATVTEAEPDVPYEREAESVHSEPPRESEATLNGSGVTESEAGANQLSESTEPDGLINSYPEDADTSDANITDVSRQPINTQTISAAKLTAEPTPVPTAKPSVATVEATAEADEFAGTPESSLAAPQSGIDLDDPEAAELSNEEEDDDHRLTD